MKYDKKEIMKKAWELFKANRYGHDFGICLRYAWKDAREVKALADANGEIRTYKGWNFFGREVRHGEKNIGQVIVFDPKTKTGTRTISFFKYEQTVELGTQPPKAV